VLLVFFALVLLICSVASQKVLLKTIDPFEPDTPSLILIIDGSLLPQTLTASTQGSGILGGERDLSLTAETGPDGRVLTAGVSLSQWDVSTPNGASGFAVMQYDGIDGSTTLNPTGLGGEDFTSLGADGLRATIQTDIDTEYTFTIYDTSGGQGDFIITVPGAIDLLTDYSIPFAGFTGNADFSSIGAIEILIELFENVDSTISLVGVEGTNIVPVPSPNPTPEPDDWYTFDDDDDGLSPYGDEEPHRRTYFLDDDRVIYYYFYGQLDDGDTVYVGFDSGSDGNTLFTSTVLLFTVITILFGL